MEHALVECGTFLAAATKDDPLRPDAERMSADLTARYSKQLVERLRRDADQHFAKSRWAEAETAYAQILKLTPGDAEAALRLGKSLFYENKIFASFKRLTLFVREHPKDARIAEVQRDIAQINDRYRTSPGAPPESLADAKRAYDRELFDDAVTHFREALVEAPFLEEARLGLARSLLARGTAARSREDLFAAVSELDDALFVHEDAPGALVIRASAYVELGDGARALADAVAVTKADPANVAAQLAAGHAQILLGRFDEAEKLMADALRREPGAATFYGHGLALEKQGHSSEALREYRQALREYRTTQVLRDRIADGILRVTMREDGR
jgi:tetratricopeptide (TPR) repeat protein